MGFRKFTKYLWAVPVLLAVLVLGGGFKLDADASAVAGVNIYRLYNPNTGEHFYTQDKVESDGLARGGWNYEGIGWVAPATGTPIHRLYNPNAPGGDHYYTTNAKEKDGLVKVGWRYEGAFFFAGGSVPLYQAYNPTENISGAHNYTTDTSEQKHLVANGWREKDCMVCS